MMAVETVAGIGTIGTVLGSAVVYNVNGFSSAWVFSTLFFMLVSFILFCICCALENQRKDEEQRRKDEEQRRKKEEQRRKNEEQRRQEAEVQLLIERVERNKCLFM